MTIISERLKKARNKKGLTQQELAKKLSISTSIIGDIESGRRVASKKTAAKLANFFNTTAEYWFDENATNDYFSNREKYAAFDNVVTTLIEKNIIQDIDDLTDDIWDIFKDSIKIDLKVILMGMKGDK